MTNTQVYLILGIGILTFLGVAAFFAWPYLTGGSLGAEAKRMTKVASGAKSSTIGETFARVADVGVSGEGARPSTSVLTTAKKLKFAQWKMSLVQYYLYAGIISFVFFVIALLKLNVLYWALSLFSGPVIMSSFVMRSVSKRFKRFDRDYPTFLLSLVGLLKTGMNPLQALGAAAENLEVDSLVRLEVEIMLERLRLGVAEEKSIGAFGEDINHSEIELFVQALLLSRRVGGTLSDTLDRLARQVRRRQFFRSQAVAAIGLQRGSIWFIVCIQAGLMFYIYVMLPNFIISSLEHPFGWQVWQGGVLVMILGIFWVRQVSNIRV